MGLGYNWVSVEKSLPTSGVSGGRGGGAIKSRRGAGTGLAEGEIIIQGRGQGTVG